MHRIHCLLERIHCLAQDALPDVLNSAVGDFNFKTVISKLGDVMYKFPFSLPPFYIAIIRCLGVLEGLAIQVDDEFRIISDAYPYIASRLLTDPSEELQSALKQLLFKEGSSGRRGEMELRWDRLQELLQARPLLFNCKSVRELQHSSSTFFDHRRRVLPATMTSRWLWIRW